MMYFRITGGQYAGMIGRHTGTLGCFHVLLVQGRDQWFFAYVRSENLKIVRRWTLNSCNGTNYIEEI